MIYRSTLSKRAKGLLADFGRENVAAVGMHDLEVFLSVVHAIDLPCFLGNGVDTSPLEIRIAKGRAHKNMARERAASTS